MTPEVVPVRGINNVFIPQFRIVPFEFADDIVRFERANLLFDLDVGFGSQRHRSKFFCDCRFLQRIEILTTIGE